MIVSIEVSPGILREQASKKGIAPAADFPTPNAPVVIEENALEMQKAYLGRLVAFEDWF